MAQPLEPNDGRVAVYIDFDNVVISRYDQVHGKESWRKDKARDAGKAAPKLDAARVDIGAILEFASSYGTITVSRAFADWSVPANARYRGQLVDRAIDLTQLFPATSTKNGADIRLAVEVIEDLFRLPDITHVVIVAGDSDYIPLAQRVRRFGRMAVGIGVTGSTSPAFVSALDDFRYYDTLLDEDVVEVAEPDPAVSASEEPSQPQQLTPTQAGRLLVRALQLGREKQDDDAWVPGGWVKQQIKRLDASFDEKSLGFANFGAFVQSRASQIETRKGDGGAVHYRLRIPKAAKKS